MTYRCGIGDGLAALGFTPGPPHVRCDAPGCAATCEAKVTRGGAPAWLRNGTAPHGWRKLKLDDGTSRDYCPAHRSVGLGVKRPAVEEGKEDG